MMPIHRRTLLRGSACAVALVALHARSRADGSAGEIEAVDLDWADAARQRAVPVRVYLPAVGAARSAPTARLPLVVFSHGIGGSRRGYSYLGQHFARHGVASLHLQHVGSDRGLWTGNVFSLVSRLQGAAQETEAVARARDLSFALDTLLASELAPRLDDSRIVAAGHSYGANTTLLAAGARVEREGRVVPLRDDRVRAAIAISAPPFYGEAEPQRILGSVTVPSLHVTCTEDVIRIPGYYSGAQDRLAVFDAVGSRRKWLAVFEGGSHSVFTDRGGTGGATLNPQLKAATQALALAFVRGVFDGNNVALAEWPQRHAALLARFTAPAA
jgi:pimeloyl-ACP methyl ester carboxylesterase